MNQEELKKMLNSVYEMEALIEMALRRDLPENHSIYGLIADKSFLIANMAAEWDLESTSQDEVVNADVDDEKVIDTFVKNCLPVDAVDSVEQPEETTPLAEEDYKEELVEEETTASDLVIDNEESNDWINTEEEVENIDEMFADSNEEDVSAEELSIEYDEEDENEIDEALPEISFADEAEVSADNFMINDEEERQFAYYKDIEERKDIRLFFTINDKFRFKRELFGNNNVEFTESLNLVQTMNTYEEAEDYFYNDLQWDSESEDVKEFMTIIGRFFKQ